MSDIKVNSQQCGTMSLNRSRHTLITVLGVSSFHGKNSLDIGT